MDFSLNHKPGVAYRSQTVDPKPMLAVHESGLHRISAQVVDRRLDHYAVVLIERGSGSLRTTNAGELVVNGPAIFWLWPEERHSYGPIAGTSWDEQWALFSGWAVKEALASAFISPGRPLLHLVNVVEMQRLFHMLRSDVAEDSPLSRASAGAHLHRIALNSVRQTRMKDQTERIPLRAVDALRQRAFEDLDLVDFAAEHGMSPATLRRRFINATGLSPKAFQIRLRLDRAKELLTIASMDVEAIAKEVGFEDPFYFSRLFARREGMSPSRFRECYRRS